MLMPQNNVIEIEATPPTLPGRVGLIRPGSREQMRVSQRVCRRNCSTMAATSSSGTRDSCINS